MKPTRWTGAVLAGGASRRMGRDKATIVVDGEPLVARAARTLRDAGADDVLVIGGGPELGPQAEATWVGDRWPGAGPLGGILTALDAAPADVVIVIACDLVDLDAATVRSLVAAIEEPALAVAVARTDRDEWTCAAWRGSLAVRALDAAFADGERAIWRAAADLATRAVPVAAPRLRNVNRPEDLPQ